MSSNVEPEEAQAILSMMEGKSHAEATISERDFRKPCRLSQPELEEVEGRAVESVGDLGTFFSDTLGSPCRVDLVGVGEANAEGLIGELGEHFALLRFQCRGAIGWLVWDNRAAVAALERIFGTAAKEPEARRLSRLENQILGNLLANFAAIAAAPLDASLEEFVVVENEAQVGSWHDAQGEPDPHRLHLEFSIDGEDETSVVHVYLPGFQKEIRAAALPADVTLPSHLEEVSVEISVRLAECEIPLAQLLSLEEGDVIPTCVPVGTPAMVLVEGQELVRARLGHHRGFYAVRAEELIEAGAVPMSDTPEQDPTNVDPEADIEQTIDDAAEAVAVQTSELDALTAGDASGESVGLASLLDVPVQITVHVGRARVTLAELVNLTPGSLLELDREASEPADILVNGKVVARGEIVTIDNAYGVRVTSVDS